MGALGIGEARVGELGQRFTAPQIRSVCEHPRRLRQSPSELRRHPSATRASKRTVSTSPAHNGERVTGFRSEDGRGSERPAQLADLRLEGIGRIRRPSVLPERIDQPIGPDRLPRPSANKASRARCLATADGHHLAGDHHLELAEELHFHAFTVRPAYHMRLADLLDRPQRHDSRTSGPERRLLPDQEHRRKEEQ